MTSRIEEMCEEYRRRGGLDGPAWLASLGLPDYTWAGPPPGNRAIQLLGWRQGGRYASPPMVFTRASPMHALSCALVVLAAAGLEAWGRPVPEELRALAALALVEGEVWWEEGYPERDA